MTTADPTDLQCKICGEKYPMNSPRVIRALKGNREKPLEMDTPLLCLVCTRLFHSVEGQKKELQEWTL